MLTYEVVLGGDEMLRESLEEGVGVDEKDWGREATAEEKLQSKGRDERGGFDDDDVVAVLML